jgi:3-dehydroquinate dehydratase-2
MKILILNGPNLNLLGQREPEIYGTLTLDEMNRQLALFGEEINEKRAEGAERVELFFYQSNHEGALIDTIQEAQHIYAGIVYNPAAHTHYSVALRDAIASIPLPVVEVHLTDISSREGFRAFSIIADACIGQFKGRGVDSYKDALEALVNYLDPPAFSDSSDSSGSYDNFDIFSTFESLDSSGASDAAAEANADADAAAAAGAEADAGVKGDAESVAESDASSGIGDAASTADAAGTADAASSPDGDANSSADSSGASENPVETLESLESFKAGRASSLVPGFEFDINTRLSALGKRDD